MTRQKLLTLWREEVKGYSPRLFMAGALMRLFPMGGFCRLRAAVYRRAGVSIGPGSMIAGPIALRPLDDWRGNIRMGARCFINHDVFIDAGAPVVMGDGVSVGHHVKIITTNHEFGASIFRAGASFTRPVTLENGVWLAADVTVLPGVTIGRGSVIGAGAVVTRDVPPNELWAGIPAKRIKSLPDGENAETALRPK